MTTDLRQQISEMREVRRLDLHARAAAALDNPGTLLDGLDEDGLTQVEELIAGRERDAAAEAERARRDGLMKRVWAASARRIAAVERAESALSELIDALAESEAARQTIAQLASAFPTELPAQLMPSEAILRASRYVAKGLTALGHPAHFGGLQIASSLTLGTDVASWCASERRIVEAFASFIESKEEQK